MYQTETKFCHNRMLARGERKKKNCILILIYLSCINVKIFAYHFSFLYLPTMVPYSYTYRKLEKLQLHTTKEHNMGTYSVSGSQKVFALFPLIACLAVLYLPVIASNKYLSYIHRVVLF